MDRMPALKKNKSLAIFVISLCAMFTASTSEADLLWPEPLEGHCAPNKSAFDSLIKQNGYILQQTSEAREGRTVMYFQAEDFMIAVIDVERSEWCIQFTSYDAKEFVKFLVGRYDPTTRGDAGTE